MPDLSHLPADLPVPLDDGACRHLVGRTVPALALASTAGGRVDLSRLGGRRLVYVYPRTGQPGQPLPIGWDQIPGARGCTPESLGFKEHYPRFLELGVGVFGLSSQDGAYQQEAVRRLGLPFPLLSDQTLAWARALELPTFEVDGVTLIRRLSLVLEGALIRHVFYPVFPPDAHAAEVLAWLRGASPSAG